MEYKEGVELLNVSAPIIYNNQKFKKINAIIFRIDEKGQKIIQAELQDLNRNSVIVCELSKVKKGESANEMG